MLDNEKKNKSEEKDKEEFTGTPEQQFPDFEAEGQKGQQKEQYENTAQNGKKEGSDN
ncbi:hypothetical protein [Planococcus antarcticus]|uniref:hypothetical protein n=1 Tax=Planococcus antarcticus TaxID=161360 RepID=UPI0002E1C27E|nr:hypothetical protein [Planococcus antarcticus]